MARVYFVVMAIFPDDIHSFDNIPVLQGATDTELGRNLFLVFLLALSRAFGAKFLDSKYAASVLGRGFDKPDSASCARAKNSPPLAVLFADMRVRGFLKRVNTWTSRT